jgi:hypothetical protein
MTCGQKLTESRDKLHKPRGNLTQRAIGGELVECLFGMTYGVSAVGKTKWHRDCFIYY